MKFCLDCSLFLCSNCGDLHRYSRKYQGHQLLDIGDFTVSTEALDPELCLAIDVPKVASKKVEFTIITR